ncbi:MAG TPA: hypothetical protein PKL22_04100, partial [Saprospiraceae bacterium]|nr:hypothetical protein [Saprospiraceae bacterium]
MKRFLISTFVIIICWVGTNAQDSLDSLWFRNNYTKMEKMIPMRDGTKLFTSIYIPRDLSGPHPII